MPKIIDDLKIEWDALARRIVISDAAMEHLLDMYCIIWGEACYDALNEHTENFAKRLLPHMRALNDELKFKR